MARTVCGPFAWPQKRSETPERSTLWSIGVLSQCSLQFLEGLAPAIPESHLEGFALRLRTCDDRSDHSHPRPLWSELFECHGIPGLPRGKASLAERGVPVD